MVPAVLTVGFQTAGRELPKSEWLRVMTLDSISAAGWGSVSEGVLMPCRCRAVFAKCRSV